MTDVLIKRELLERARRQLANYDTGKMIGAVLDAAPCDPGCAEICVRASMCATCMADMEGPRQPEGDGPEVVGFSWLDTAHFRRKIPVHCIDEHWVALCRLSDHLRAIAELREECERLRMQLAACGVVALANTPESASEARQMHQDYMSASCSDVAGAVDREMTLRQQLAELREECERVKADRASCWAEFKVMTRSCLEAEKERDTLRQQLAERDADAERWRYTQHPDYICCGPYDTDGDYCGYSVGVLKHANGKQLSLNHCIEGRGDSLGEAIDAALAEIENTQ